MKRTLFFLSIYHKQISAKQTPAVYVYAHDLDDFPHFVVYENVRWEITHISVLYFSHNRLRILIFISLKESIGKHGLVHNELCICWL